MVKKEKIIFFGGESGWGIICRQNYSDSAWAEVHFIVITKKKVPDPFFLNDDFLIKMRVIDGGSTAEAGK
ncbi:MAG: hypothetical protein JXD22_16955 [Sedimentisphaerales bacterium]|nr:hypothetical protein [Sedimentisphaerales bacterium]